MRKGVSDWGANAFLEYRVPLVRLVPFLYHDSPFSMEAMVCQYEVEANSCSWVLLGILHPPVKLVSLSAVLCSKLDFGHQVA